MTPQEFRKIIYNYYRKHKRTLPWRWESDPYKVFVSEVMLQQTQVPRVLVKYPSFIKRFPSFQSLAKASLSGVLAEWQGMGYNRRGKYLREAAKMVVEDSRYSFMRESARSSSTRAALNSNSAPQVALLQQLPGIGHATASAIVAYAFNKPVVFLETNIRAVYLFHYFPKEQNVSDKAIMELIKETLDYAHPREWYYALTDYGSMLKKKEKFQNIQSKHYAKQSKFQGSRRQIRGRVLKLLLTKGSLSLDQIKKELQEDERAESVVHELELEGIITKDSETNLFRI